MVIGDNRSQKHTGNLSRNLQPDIDIRIAPQEKP